LSIYRSLARRIPSCKPTAQETHTIDLAPPDPLYTIDFAICIGAGHHPAGAALTTLVFGVAELGQLLIAGPVTLGALSGMTR